MKQRVRISLSVACLLALLTVSALAQNQELQEAKKKAEPSIAGEEIKFREELFKVVGARFVFEIKVVKGAPYSARVSKRPTHQSAACLRARYCTDLAWLDLDIAPARSITDDALK
jgi:hypothetical protein